MIIFIKEVFTPSKMKATSPSMEAPTPIKMEDEHKEEMPPKVEDKPKVDEKLKTMRTMRKWAPNKVESTHTMLTRSEERSLVIDYKQSALREATRTSSQESKFGEG